MELAKASGLRLPLHEDYLARERYLFYVCASRAERLLVLSTRYCDEEGNPESPSFFLEDARAVFAGGLEDVERRRSLADVTWSLEQAPTDAEWERAVARAGPRRAPEPVASISTPAALSALEARDVVSAGALEAYAGCPVKWLVEKVLRPDALEPDPEPMVRGAYAHSVLEATLKGLEEATGSMEITRGSLAEAEALMQAALTDLRGEFRLSPNQVRVRAAVTSLEFDLLRYLRHEAERDSAFTPAHLELEFGFEESDHPAVRLADGTMVRGRIDRIDTSNGHAVVIDYKSGRVGDYKAADWDKQARFQAALYMLVVEEVLGLEPAGGVYLPLGGEERRARGALNADLRTELGDAYYDNDLLPGDEFAALNDRAREKIGEAAAGMRAGALCSTPDSCAYRGGCSHPSICRVEAP
jgi:ATP-dependent helicase/DNAse subunit B